MAERTHYLAQICENGHIVTSMLDNFPGKAAG